MNMMINTLEFAETFESAGFGHEQAKALASAFGRANEVGREDLMTRTDLALFKSELMQALADQGAYLTKTIADQNITMTKSISDQNVTLTKAIADNGKDINGRLWSTITILVGVSTAISAAVGSAVALLLKSQGL
jgi:hypothetical protein